METFITIGFGILIAFILVCIAQYIGNTFGEVIGDGLYGNSK